MRIRAWGPLFALAALFASGLAGMRLQYTQHHSQSQPAKSENRNGQNREAVALAAPEPANAKAEKRGGEDGFKLTDWLLVLFNGLLALYTWRLYLATRGLVHAAEIQSSDMKLSIAAAESASVAAQVSADASKTAAEHVPKTERAYLFLESDINSNLEDLFDLHPEATIQRAEIVFGFRNHGRTPAIVQSLHVGVRYWDKPISDNWDDAVPSMTSTGQLTIQPGLVISSEPVGGYKAELNLTREQFDNALQGRRGCVMFWGKIVYLDVFKERHETGWCRVYMRGAGKFWRFGGNEALNYYT
jgi:hypothetical protein